MIYTKESIRARLDELGIEYKWLEHPAVKSMDECVPIGEKLGAHLCKNLLLTNRQQTNYYLFLTTEFKPFRTSVFSKALGVSRLSFATAEQMKELLGVEPGSASALALYNDPEGRVQLVIDNDLLSWDRIGVHPADHTASLSLETRTLLELCRGDIRHVPIFVTVAERE